MCKVHFFFVLTGLCLSVLIWSSISKYDTKFESQVYPVSKDIPITITIKSENVSYIHPINNRPIDHCLQYYLPDKLLDKDASAKADYNMLVSIQASNYTNNNDKIKSGQVEKGVWFYANSFGDSIPFAIVDQLVNLKFNTIYFAGTTISDWKDFKKFQMYFDFICYAYSKGLDAYAVTLEDPLFAFGRQEQIQKEFREFILSTKNLFDTFMIDVEPHTLHLSDPLVYVPQYIRMSLALQEISDKYNVTYIDTVPYWYHFVIKNMGISPGLNILGGDRVNLMVYTYTANQSINNVKAVLPEVQKPVTVSIKTTPGFGDPYLNGEQLKSTIENFENNSVGFGLFESQFLLRNLP